MFTPKSPLGDPLRSCLPVMQRFLSIAICVGFAAAFPQVCQCQSDHADANALIRILDGDDPIAAYECITELAKFPQHPTVIHALIKHLDDQLPLRSITTRSQYGAGGIATYQFEGPATVGGRCLNCLISIGEAAVPQLISEIKGSDIEEGIASFRFRQVLYCLGGIKDTRAVRPILNYLNRSDAKMKDIAISALGDIGDKSAWPVISRYLHDEDSNLCAQAALAAEKIMGDQASEPLIRLLRSSDAKVKARALLALGRLTPNSKSRSAATLCLRDRDSDVRWNAFYYLQFAGACNEAIPLLLEEIDTDKNKCQSYALDAIRNCTDPNATPAIAKLLLSDHPKVSHAALYAAGQLRDPTMIRPLIRLFERPETRVETQCRIIDVLASTPGDEVNSRLLAFSKDPELRISQRAQRALLDRGQCMDPKPAPAANQGLNHERNFQGYASGNPVSGNPTSADPASEAVARLVKLLDSLPEPTPAAWDTLTPLIQELIDQLRIEGRLGNKKVIIQSKVFHPGDELFLNLPLRLESIEADQLRFSFLGLEFIKTL